MRVFQMWFHILWMRWMIFFHCFLPFVAIATAAFLLPLRYGLPMLLLWGGALGYAEWMGDSGVAVSYHSPYCDCDHHDDDDDDDDEGDYEDLPPRVAA